MHSIFIYRIFSRDFELSGIFFELKVEMYLETEADLEENLHAVSVK
jgi:hypothetical protein